MTTTKTLIARNKERNKYNKPTHLYKCTIGELKAMRISNKTINEIVKEIHTKKNTKYYNKKCGFNHK